MITKATPDNLAAIVAFQERAYAGNRAIKGVEPLPLSVDYREIYATMELWIDGAPEAPSGVLVLDTDPARHGSALFLWSIATDPAQRGTGRGNRLLDFVEARARTLGRDAVTLTTNTRLTERVAWYQRHGFVITGEERLSDRSVFHMRKALDGVSR